MSSLKETTIRDFGGGWNVSDSDKALTPKYQRLSDNIVRGTDGHLRKRYGDKLFSDFRKGVETDMAATALTVATTNNSGRVRITKTAHGYTSGQHIDIKSFSADINGLTVDQLEGNHDIVVVDADNFDIYVRGAATSTGSALRTVSWTHDTHLASARQLFGRYYKDHLIVFFENGEIAAVNQNGVPQIIWNFNIANGLTLEPWTRCKRVSAEIVRGRLIAVNGYDCDKPIAIDDLVVSYLVDASTLSNGAIPRADLVVAASNYVILINTEYGATKLEIGAKNTVMTCSRETAPDDAVEIDLGMLTQTVDATILGASVIRSRVFIAFADRSMLGTLGIYTEAGHEPDFNDNIAEVGGLSHNAIISVGNDLFSPAMNGVNSLEVSRASGEFTPSTVSDLIHPVLLRHMWRLSEDDRRYRMFAVWDTTSRSYMLFLPKYSDMEYTAETDGVFVTTTLHPNSLAYIRVPDNKLDAGDWVDISGVTNYDSDLVGSMINGRRRIRHTIPEENIIVVEVDAYPPNYNVSFGGAAVIVKPVNDESVGYVYEYNTRLKIRRWTRFRGLQYEWGAPSQFNRLFFGNEGKVYQLGDPNNPFNADKIGDYDFAAFANSKNYAEGDRVLDGTVVYQSEVAHTSPASGTFADARSDNPTYWSIYEGEPISFEVELSWGDFDARTENKQIELVGFDTSGNSPFTCSIFVNSIYLNYETYERTPVVETEFTGENTPGFGAGTQPFGGGRNTANEWLHAMPVHGKLFLIRLSGSSRHPLKINAVTLHYHKSRIGSLT